MSRPPSPPAARRTRRDAVANRQRVLDGAAAVFAERGLGVPLAEVAKASGVGVGTLCRAFPDKDELILAVYQSRMDDAVAFAEQSSTATDPGAGFRSVIEAGARDLADDRGFRELVLGGLTDTIGWARSGPPTSLVQAIDRMNIAVSGHLATLIARGKAAGTLRLDIEPTDVQLVNTAVQAVVAFADATRPGASHRMITMILDGLRPRSDATPMPAPPLTETELTQAIRPGHRGPAIPRPRG